MNSSYAKDLCEEAKEQFKKLEIINGLDPFNAGAIDKLVDCLPPLEAADIVLYLVCWCYRPVLCQQGNLKPARVLRRTISLSVDGSRTSVVKKFLESMFSLAG